MKIVALISLILVAINGMRVERMRHTPDHHARVDHGGARVGMHHTAKIQRGDSRMRQRHVPRLIKDNEGGKSIIESDNVNGVPTITFCNTTSTPLIVDRFDFFYVFVLHEKIRNFAILRADHCRWHYFL